MDLQTWTYFVQGYKMGKSKRGNPCWVEEMGEDSISDSLNQFGRDGWELVSSVYAPGEEMINCFFKRPRRGSE